MRRRRTLPCFARGLRVVWTPYAELAYLRGRGPYGSGAPPPPPRRAEGPARYLVERWGRALREDPYYSPNLDLGYGDYALSFPPRATRPWRARRAKRGAGEVGREAV